MTDRAEIAPTDGTRPGHGGNALAAPWAAFDHVAAAGIADPAGLMAPMREQCPVGRSDIYGGFYVLTRARDIRQAAKMSDVFSSSPELGPGIGFPHASGHGMIRRDPPLHRDFREPLQRRFSAASVELLAHHIRGIVSRLIDDFIEAGEADLAYQLCVPIPVIVTCELLGLPFDRSRELRAWAQELVSTGSAQANEKMLAFIADLYDQRISSPQDDIPTAMLEITPGLREAPST